MADGAGWVRWQARGPGRIDREVGSKLKWPRSRVRLAISAGRVFAGPSVVSKPGVNVEGGQSLAVRAEDWLQPEPDAPLQVLAEDPESRWVVFNKPEGQAVHPLSPVERGTLLQAGAARFPELCSEKGVGREGPLRSGVVHRIDGPTSGCVVVARTDPAWDLLRDAFAGHRIRKTYLARVAGRPAAGSLEAPMAVVAHRPARAGVVGDDDARGRATSMTWVPLSTDPAGRTTLLEVTLETGFFHQIRAGMAHLGWPVVGDWLYRGPEAKRLLLHAWRLGVPELGLQAEAPPPPGLRPPADPPAPG